MRALIQILTVLALISVITVLVSQNRYPVRTLAWILILILLPGLGLVLYFLFGTNKKSNRLISDEKLDMLKSRSIRANGDMIDTEVPGGHRDLATLLYMTNKSLPMKGNELEVFTDFDNMSQALIRDIRQARDHVNFEFFKFEDDNIGHRIADELIALTHRGVEVRVTYDAAANLTRVRFYRYLRKAGVRVKAFLPLVLPFLSTNDTYRNHRKIVVIDGKIGYVGGMNIADRYSIGIRSGDWRDTHLRIEGPAVSELQTAFLVDWQFCSKEFLCEERFYPRIEARGGSCVQIATSGPMDEWNVTMQGIIRLVTQAKRYVYLESPYFIPTEPVMMALRNAALSGVDVRIIIPYHGDRGIIVPLASRSYVEEALVAGVKIYFYNGGYMHSKTSVADDSVASIGSTNLDVRSFEQNFEVNAFIYDPEVAVQLREAFLKDQANSREVSLEGWRQRPRWERLKESVARLFSPIL